MEDIRLDQIKEVLETDENVEKVAACTSAKEMKEVFDAWNIKFSDEEMAEMYNVIQEQLNKEETDELDENNLEDVNGGIGIVGGCIFVAGCYVAGRVYGSVARKKLGYLFD